MKVERTRARFLASLLAVFAASTYAQERDQVITYPYKAYSGSSKKLEAVLRLPAGEGNKRAVVILHDGGGWSAGRTRQYADLFTAHGFVTIEPRVYRSPGEWDIYNDLPKVFGALTLLAKRAEVDPAHIYVIGQSAGATLAIMAASVWANKQFNDSGTQFRGHAPFYPTCWRFVQALKDKPRLLFKEFPKEMFQEWNGSRVKLFIGTRDDYDDGDVNTCSDFVAQIPNEARRKAFSIVKYEGATHGWDHGNTYSFYAPTACKGRGCTNHNVSDPEVTRKPYQDVLDFFAAD